MLGGVCSQLGGTDTTASSPVTSTGAAWEEDGEPEARCGTIAVSPTPRTKWVPESPFCDPNTDCRTWIWITAWEDKVSEFLGRAR